MEGFLLTAESTSTSGGGSAYQMAQEMLQMLDAMISMFPLARGSEGMAFATALVHGDCMANC